MRHATRFFLGAARAPSGVVLMLTLISGGLPVVFTWLTKLLLDRVASHQVDAALVWLVGSLTAAVLLSTVLPHLSALVQQMSRRRVEFAMHDELFTAVNRVPGLRIFDEPAFYDELQLAQQAKDRAPAQVVAGGCQLLQGAVSVSGFLASLAALDPMVAGVGLLAALPGIFVEGRLGRLREQCLVSIAPLERRRFLFGRVQVDRCAAQEIRAFDAGEYLRRRMLDQIRRINDHETERDRREWRLRFRHGVFSAIIAGVALLIALRQAASGRLTVGDVAVVIAGISTVQAGLAAVIRSCGQTHEALLLMDHHRHVAELTAQLSARTGVSLRPVAPLRTAIEMRDVWFRYDERLPWVIRGLDLRIEVGECVGLVGLNGAGKSTLVKLLLGLLEPARGAVLWDGIDIRHLDPYALRQRTSVVFQDFMAWDLTATENIRLGDLDHGVQQAAIQQAAERAGVHAFLSSLPHGYQTLLSRLHFPPDASGEDPGVVPSGGQWQRLAVARSLLRADRDVLILDEPSSGLDAEAEEGLHERLRYLRSGRASLLISHRLSTVRRADRILVLADGRVLEQGTHEQLIEENGRYARLFRLQAEGYRDEPFETNPTASIASLSPS
jgi:ATP-binding cassette subfamily B protein